jgi:hypothetical protein
VHRFVIRHLTKGYFMNGSTHLPNEDRFSLDLQEAKVYSTLNAAKGSITSNFTNRLRFANPTFVNDLEVIPVCLSL